MANPAKFDRCVKKVRARSKGRVNAYAVCTAAGMRKPNARLYFTVSAPQGKYPSYHATQADAEKAAKAQSLDQASEVSVYRTEDGRSKAMAKVRGGKVYLISKSNPESSAADMYESFHGAPSEEVVELVDEEHYHGNLAALGVLVELKLVTTTGYDVTLMFSDPEALISANPLPKFAPPKNASEAFKAGYRYYLSRVKTAKGSFNAGSGAETYSQKFGIRDMSVVGMNESTRARIKAAQEAYEQFLDGTVAAHEDRLKYQHPDSEENPGLWTKLKSMAKRKQPWVVYDTKATENAALESLGKLQAKGVTAKINRKKVGGSVLRPIYSFEILVDRERLQRMFKEDELSVKLEKAYKKQQDEAERQRKIREREEDREERRSRSSKSESGSRFSSTSGSKVKKHVFKGYTIEEKDGEFIVPEIDKESRFESLKDAKMFIAVQKKENPVEYYYIYDGQGKHTHGPLGSVRASSESAALTIARKKWPSKTGLIAISIGDPSNLPTEQWDQQKQARFSTGTNPKHKGPFQSASEVIGSAGRYLDGQLGRVLNPVPTFTEKNLPGWFVEWADRNMGWDKSDFFDMSRSNLMSPNAKDWKEAFKWKYGRYPINNLEEHMGQALVPHHKGIARTSLKANPGTSQDLTLLTSNERGTQLYVSGGDQSIDLSTIHMGDVPVKDSMVLGEAYFISYFTTKDFDDHQPTIYEHDLAEETDPPSPKYKKDEVHAAKNRRLCGTGTGGYPIVRYDTMNQKVYLDGGVYKIEKPWTGTSPGIED